MTTEQQPEDKKAEVPVLMTAGLMELKIKGALSALKITLPELETRACAIVQNRDGLTAMKDLFADSKKVRDVAEVWYDKTSKPYWNAFKQCGAGKKLILDQLDRIEGMHKRYYDKELAAIAEETRVSNLKKAQNAAILKGIEDNLITFSNMVVGAITRKDLTAVESRINFEKSPSKASKYGEFHQKAIERYDAVLLPIIKDQKVKVEELEELNRKILEAEAHNDPDKMDELTAQVDEKSNEILQNHAIIQEAALNQDSFPVMEATEVLPEFKTKRTNFSYEIEDVEVAWKKARHLLEISINKEAAKVVLDELKKANAFEGKDAVVRDGIKYIATRVREAL